jgi:hypothetical protein
VFETNVDWCFGTSGHALNTYPSLCISPQKKERQNKEAKQKQNKGCVPLWPLPFTFKSILMKKKNYENSNISLCKNIIFKKSS